LSSFKKATVTAGIILMCSILLLIVMGCEGGQGKISYDDGQEYVGEIKDGEPHGQGTATFANNNKYVGEFKGGLFHGLGTFTFADGRVLVGRWENDEFIGE
jgi:hypothetical protein